MDWKITVGDEIICEGFLATVESIRKNGDIMVTSPPKRWKITPKLYYLLEKLENN